MFLFIREFPKSRKNSFFSVLIFKSPNILKEISVKFLISDDMILGILHFSNKLLTSDILYSSLSDSELYNSFNLSLSLLLNNSLAFI